MKGGAMLFLVTGITTCPKCKHTRSFSVKLNAESDQAAMERFQESHRYCFNCLMYGIQRRLNFESTVEVEENEANLL